MGNRAVIQFTPKQAVHIHWNGGRDSVEGFLDACKTITEHGWQGELKGARLFEQVAKAFFEGNSTVEFDKPDALDCDNGDNGLYYVNAETWAITGRAYFNGVDDDDKRKRVSVGCACVINFLKEATK